MSNQKIILTKNAPQPVGPYSQAIEVNNMLFCSGQIPLDPKTGEIVGKTAAEQVVVVLDNLKAVLGEAGFGFRDIVKTTIFMTNLAEFSEVNKIYEAKLEGHKPARSTVQVAALPKGALIEIECIAIKNV